MMSCTEIYGFNKDGNAFLYGEVPNAWRGAMSVWKRMEKRYLPRYVPRWMKASWKYRDSMTDEEIIDAFDYLPSRLTSVDQEAAGEIWALFENDSVDIGDRVVLGTTLDNVLVRKNELDAVARAFEVFEEEPETSLPEQAVILRKMMEDEDIIAVGWNQTSVNADSWESFSTDDETGDDIPYNCLTGTKHWWLFDELEKGAKNT
jgi:hypothetical protein